MAQLDARNKAGEFADFINMTKEPELTRQVQVFRSEYDAKRQAVEAQAAARMWRMDTVGLARARQEAEKVKQEAERRTTEAEARVQSLELEIQQLRLQLKNTSAQPST